MDPIQPSTQQPIQPPVQIPDFQPKPNYFVIIVSSILGIILLGATILLYFQNQQLKIESKVTNFSECSSVKGSLLRESYPTVCVLPSGKSFTEDLTDKEKSILVPPKETRPTISISSPPDETAKWKIYKTSKYEVKYPSTWNVNISPLEGESLFKIIPNSNANDNFYPGFFIEFKSINNTSLETQESIYKNINLAKSEVFFKNLPAVKYAGASSTKNVGGRIIPGIIQETYILLENSGYVYTFGYSYEESTINKNQEDFFDQILSTFKFVN